MSTAAVRPPSFRLQVIARSFVAVVIAAVLLNLLLLLAMHRAGLATQAAIDQREAAQADVSQLLQETDLLSHLVQRYVTTGEPRYLALYDDILAVRRGERPAPAAADLASHWRARLANAADAPTPRSSAAQALAQRLQTTRWQAEEKAAWHAVLQAAEPLLAIERMAIAARNSPPPGTGNALAQAAAERDRAQALVQSDAYDAHRAELTAAVSRLQTLVAARSQSEVDAARRHEQHARFATLLVNLLLIPVVVAGSFVMRHQVLRPIAQLVATARRYAAGDYAAPQQGNRATTDELDTLADALQRMADATAEELRRRDQSQRELRAARDAAEAAAQTKAMFLANMSHEIRTPMNAIMGMTQLAMRTPLTLRQRDYLDKSLAASRHLLGLIDDVLDFSKIEAGGMALELRPMVLEAVAAQALSLVRQRASDKQLTLLLVVDDGALLGTDGQLLGDALRLGQVLTNLLSNAVKFTPSGCVTLTLARDAEVATPDPADTVPLCLSVSDTGIGLTPEQIDGLFRQFSQADASTTRRFGGTGLGLAISQRLVGLMGGRIAVESQPGSGSRFSIHLRLQRAAPPVSSAAGMAAPPPRHVLLADALPASRQAVRDLLRHLLPAGGRVHAVDGLLAVAPALRAAVQADAPFHWLLIDDALTDGLSPMLLANWRSASPGLQVVALRGAANSGLAGLPALDKPVLPAPLRALLADQCDLAASTGRAWGTDSGQRPAARLAGLRVLLVEDNALNRQLAQELLSFEGAVVRSAENGLEALERLHTDGASAYDVVLMDLQMPVMDGYEAVRRLRQMPSLDAVPVLAMTAHAMAGDRARCLALGMQGHIAKPVDADALVALLQAHLPRPASALRSSG